MKLITNKILFLTISLVVFSSILSTQLKNSEDNNLLNFFNNMYSSKTKKQHSIFSEVQKLSTRSRSRRVSKFPNNRFFQKELNLTAQKNNTNATNAFNTSKMLEDWVKISSYEFQNSRRFPLVVLANSTEDIVTDQDRFRLNLVLSNDTKKPNNDFYFRLNKEHIFYASTPKDINVLGDIELLLVTKAEKS